jgi:hypothetical protein
MASLKQSLKDQLQGLERNIANFCTKDHLTYSAFEVWLDEKYPPVTVGQYAFMPSKVLHQCNMDAYFDMFNLWADTVNKEDLTEYQQLVDNREQILEWLTEI